MVGLLFFFTLLAPSPVWPALGIRGFMLLAGLCIALVAHLLLSRRALNVRVVSGVMVLFLLALVPSTYWSELRLMLYPLFFVTAVLLVSQATTEERNAFIEYSTRFLLVVLVGGVIGYGLSAAGMPPLAEFDNTDGRPNYVFYTTLTNSFVDGFIRPSGIYDEPGALSFFVCLIAYLREATGKSRRATLTLLTLGLVTFSIMHMIFLVLYLVASAVDWRRAVSFVGLLVLTIGAFVAIAGAGTIENQVLSRLLLTEEGNLAGDTRTVLLLNAVDVLATNEHATLMGAHSACTLDSAVCIEAFGPMGENPLSPLVSQGLFLSWPYYLFLLVGFASLRGGRHHLLFFGVALLFMQRPYLLNLGYSVAGAMAFAVHIGPGLARRHRQKRLAPLVEAFHA